jgi:hypothetical protein
MTLPCAHPCSCRQLDETLADSIDVPLIVIIRSDDDSCRISIYINIKILTSRVPYFLYSKQHLSILTSLFISYSNCQSTRTHLSYAILFYYITATTRNQFYDAISTILLELCNLIAASHHTIDVCIRSDEDDLSTNISLPPYQPLPLHRSSALVLCVSSTGTRTSISSCQAKV